MHQFEQVAHLHMYYPGYAMGSSSGKTDLVQKQLYKSIESMRVYRVAIAPIARPRQVPRYEGFHSGCKYQQGTISVLQALQDSPLLDIFFSRVEYHALGPL